MRTSFSVILVFAACLLVSCGGESDRRVDLGGYEFRNDSAVLTNPWFPAQAGDSWNFTGFEGFEGERYVWDFTEGGMVAGVWTVRERGTHIRNDGGVELVFDSWLAQDAEGNIHVLQNNIENVLIPNGVAAGSDATFLLPGKPEVDESFGPDPNLKGTVISLDAEIDGYTGVLHTRFLGKANGKGGFDPSIDEHYDDYWATGVGQIHSDWRTEEGVSGHWKRVLN